MEDQTKGSMIYLDSQIHVLKQCATSPQRNKYCKITLILN